MTPYISYTIHFMSVIYIKETWTYAYNGKGCAWVERDNVIGGTLGGIKGLLGRVHGLLFFKMIARWVGFPIPFSYSDPKQNW